MEDTGDLQVIDGADSSATVTTGWAVPAIAILTLMTAGRAMTLAFVTRAGDGGAGDPPAAWLMPLVGDAVIGITAVALAVAVLRRPSPGTWLAAVVWSALAIFDAIAAFLVELSVPWPEFFMIEVFGSSMFFAASAMHLLAIWLVTGHRLRTFYLSPSAP